MGIEDFNMESIEDKIDFSVIETYEEMNLLPYGVTITLQHPDINVLIKMATDCRVWCEDSLGDQWTMDNQEGRWYADDRGYNYGNYRNREAPLTVDFWFVNESDAMLFALRWR